jgi:hypothetical protein
MGSRSEFEKSFFNPENSLYRRAVLMYALAIGPDWKTWSAVGSAQTQPSFYNEIGFLACYHVYRNDPTVGRTIQMRDFMLVRSGSDAGFLADPVNKDSDTRKLAKSNVRETIVSFQSGPNKGDSSQAMLNIYNAVYSEMWLQGAAMRQFVAQPGLGSVLRTLGQNTRIVKADADKSFWLQSLIGRFSGTTVTSQRYGQTFDTRKLGFTGSDSTPLAGHHRPVVMGGHRG